MQITAIVTHSAGANAVRVQTGAAAQSLDIPARAGGGCAINGGEFLMLALATCYCNDIYREAARLGISVDRVEVEATAEFPGVGLAARDIRYRARVKSSAPAQAIAELLRQTDGVAEVHNTVRAGVPVSLLLD